MAAGDGTGMTSQREPKKTSEPKGGREKVDGSHFVEIAS
jgi:hypothetical protein